MSTKTSTKPEPETVYTSGAVILALSKAAAGSSQSARPILQEIAASVDSRGVVSFAATDSYRLAAVEIGEKVDAGHAGAAGRWRVDDLKRLVKSADLVAVKVDAGAVALEVVEKAPGAPALQVPASTINGTYPNWRALLDTSAAVKPAGAMPHIANINACYLKDACEMVKAMCAAMPCMSLRNGGSTAPLIATAKLSGKIKGTGRKTSGRLWYMLMPVRSDAAEGTDFKAPVGWYDLEDTASADKAAQDKIKLLEEEIKQLKAEADDNKINTNADLVAKLEAANKIIEAQANKIAALESVAAKTKPATPADPATPAGPATLESIAAANATLAYWRTPLCEWVSGDTKPHTAALKAAGAKWSAKKNAWYRRLEDTEKATA